MNGPCGNLKHCVVPRDTERLSIYTDKEYCVPVNVAAAAPDMLEALRLMLKADETICENIGKKSDQAMLRIAALDAARAAIAKATGVERD